MASLFFMPVNHGGLNVENTYHGKPCKRCGGTLRYLKTSGCIVCQHTKDKPRLNTGEKENGKPCRVCGETLRYLSDGNCVACTKRKNAIKVAKRRAKNATIPKATPGSDRCLSCGETKNYFFLDYCRECRTAEKQRTPEPEKTYSRCEWCGEWKPYRITGACKTCEAAEKRRRAYWEAEDKLRAVEAAQRRYSDPF